MKIRSNRFDGSSIVDVGFEFKITGDQVQFEDFATAPIGDACLALADWATQSVSGKLIDAHNTSGIRKKPEPPPGQVGLHGGRIVE